MSNKTADEGPDAGKMTLDEILTKPYWIVDILPKQVPENSPGHFFAVEKFFLEPSRFKEIKQKHINVILKLNCYMDINMDGEINPPPDRIAQEMQRRYIWFRIGDSMILSEKDDLHMTLFNPDRELLELVKEIARGEGLFVWQPGEAQ